MPAEIVRRRHWSVAGVIAAATTLFALSSASVRAVDVSSLTIESLAATRDKPLFSPTRQKPPAPNARAATPAPINKASEENARPAYALVGIIADADAVMVLLRDSTKDELIKVQSGERLGNWVVLATSNYSVQLQNGEQKLDLRIFAE